MACICQTPRVCWSACVKANDSVVEALKAAGALLVHKAYKHSYPHCWRHKTPIIFRATPQWFVSMDQAALRSTSLNEIAQTRWIPDWGQQRMKIWWLVGQIGVFHVSAPGVYQLHYLCTKTPVLCTRKPKR